MIATLGGHRIFGISPSMCTLCAPTVGAVAKALGWVAPSELTGLVPSPLDLGCFTFAAGSLFFESVETAGQIRALVGRLLKVPQELVDVRGRTYENCVLEVWEVRRSYPASGDGRVQVVYRARLRHLPVDSPAG